MRGLLLAILLLGARPAGATEGDARGLLAEAIQAFNRGAVDESLRLLEQARAGTSESRLLGQIALYLGLNHAAEGRRARARQAFVVALGHDPTLRLDPYRTKPELVALFEEVRRERVAVLQVRASQPAAVVWLDGDRAGKVPLKVSVSPGAHALELRTPQGATLYQRRVELLAGRVTLVEVLVATPARAVQPPPATAAAPPRPRRRLWTWIALGGAVAASAVAIGLGASARSDHDQACSLLLDTGARCEDRSAFRPGADRQLYRELYDAVGAKSLGSNIAWGIAGGLALTSLVLSFVEVRASSRDGERGAAVTLTPGPGALGLGLALRR